MKSDNYIQISGYLTKDATTNEKLSYASFSIAHKLNVHEAMFFNCIIFSSKQKSIPFDLLRKGKEIFIVGKLRPNTYQSGNITYKGYQVVVEKIREVDN